MIIGIGCDIVNIKRINLSDAFLQRFQNRILGPAEISELSLKKLSGRQLAATLAKYYAGKEAFVKALGTGFRNGIFLKDIQIVHDSLGKPLIKLSGKAKAYVQSLSSEATISITLSDDFPYAQAVVVIEN